MKMSVYKVIYKNYFLFELSLETLSEISSEINFFQKQK
ncbi:MAG: hypothetical protein RL344_1003 [Pseudomonadota bacterium]|jgi:hypothetical protein